MKVLYFKNHLIGFFIVCLLCLAYMGIEMHTHRFTLCDFEVYYKSARRIMRGENLYKHSEDGHYIYKYSPPAAVYFIPFSLVSFSIAKIFYWFFLTGCIMGGFYLCLRMILNGPLKNNAGRVNTAVLLSIPILGIDYFRELYLGQVNHLIMVLYITSLYLLINEKKGLFSFLVAISLFLKPFGIIFIPYLAIKKRFKEIIYLGCATALIACLPFLFFRSVSFTLGQYGGWFEELMIELSHKQDLLMGANHTVFSVLARFSPIRFFFFSEGIEKLYQMTVLILLGIGFLWFVKWGRTVNSLPAMVTEYAVLMTAIPLVSFTSENAFGIVELLVFILLCCFHRIGPPYKVFSIAGFILLGLNQYELFGRDLSNRLNDLSLITIGAMILVGVAAGLRKKSII